MKINSKLKNLLIRIIIIIILLILKKYIDLDFINDLLVDLVIAISAFFGDFNPFEITKEFFNEKSGDEGEGSNRQNNNTPDRSINPPSFEESPEEAIEDEESSEEVIGDEEDRVSREEETRLTDQIQMREDVIAINQQALFEKRVDIDRRMRDFVNLKNQSESDESMIPVLADIERQLAEEIESLKEYDKTINDEARASKAEIGDLLLKKTKIAARRIEKSISESESESDSE